jgi:hypothetical protein
MQRCSLHRCLVPHDAQQGALAHRQHQAVREAGSGATAKRGARAASSPKSCAVMAMHGAWSLLAHCRAGWFDADVAASPRRR